MRADASFFVLLLLLSPIVLHAQTTIPAGALISADTTWASGGNPYVLDCGIVVNAGVTLSISPDVVIKSQCSSSGTNATLLINGSLIANGTAIQPITFTSIKDDSVAGDTNGDGNATTPAAGDWDGIVFQPGSSGSISNVVLRYGAGYGVTGNGNILAVARGMVHIASGNSSVSVMTSTLSFGSLNAIYVTGNETNPTISSNTFISNSPNFFSGGAGAVYVIGTSATVTGNTFAANGQGIVGHGATLTASSNVISLLNAIGPGAVPAGIWLDGAGQATCSTTRLPQRTKGQPSA